MQIFLEFLMNAKKPKAYNGLREFLLGKYRQNLPNLDYFIATVDEL